MGKIMEMNQTHDVNTDIIKNLAISDSGFVFDPTIGKSYTVNESALWILKQLQQDQSFEMIELLIIEEFDVTNEQAERDLGEFFEQLNRFIH